MDNPVQDPLFEFEESVQLIPVMPRLLLMGLLMFDISALNNADIESITILKDAATALYGARGQWGYYYYNKTWNQGSSCAVDAKMK